MAQITFNEPEPKLSGKIKSLPWLFILVVMVIGGIGGGALYSAANASFLPWAKPHLIRFGITLVIMLAFAFVDIRIWFRMAYPAYALMLALLAGVEVAGKVGAFGAQRWINLGFVQIQPSELMKIALVMALARYFHACSSEDSQRLRPWSPR
jgi:rod shape determining protein RodA